MVRFGCYLANINVIVQVVQPPKNNFYKQEGSAPRVAEDSFILRALWTMGLLGWLSISHQRCQWSTISFAHTNLLMCDNVGLVDLQ